MAQPRTKTANGNPKIGNCCVTFSLSRSFFHPEKTEESIHITYIEVAEDVEAKEAVRQPVKEAVNEQPVKEAV